MSELNALSICGSDVTLMLSIHSNDIKTVTNLLSLCKVDPDTLFRVTMSEIPAIMYCIEKGNYEMAKVFINNNCSVNRTDQNGLTALHLSVQHQNVELVNLLIDRRASVNYSTVDTLNTPLHYACSLRSVEIVRLLVEHGGADVNKSNIDGVTPLMSACSHYRVDIVRYLLSTGRCNVNAVDNKKSSALIYATGSTIRLSKELIQTLIEHGADVNQSSSEGCTVLNTLITSSSESDLTDNYYFSIFIMDCFSYELVSLLIDYGCDLEYKKSNFRSLTPIHLSIVHNQDSITELFIRSGCNLNSININDEPVLLSLIKANKTHLVRLAIDAGANLNFFNYKLEQYFKLTTDQLIDRVTDRELKNYLRQLFSTDYRIGSLKHLSRIAICRCLGRKADQQIALLNVPVLLKNYLLLKEN